MGWSIKKIVNAAVGAVVGATVGVGAVVGGVVASLFDHSPSTGNTNTGTLSEINNDTNVYIPETLLTFEGELFKPNTRLYTFFDGKDVSEYVTPEGSTMGNPLVTDNSGHIKGTLLIPNNSVLKFVQGKKELKFTDSSKNGDDETTFSSTYYTYAGDQDQTEVMDLGGIQTGSTTADPFVQSFWVLDTGGIYLRSLNLYFLTKDPKYPILFQIREVNEDRVSNTYLRNSNFVLHPNQINVSADGSTATSIELSAPVYLQEGKEYALYMFTNAPATYTLATCIYGETNSINQLSTKDPRIGSIMKYLGSDVWLRDNSKGVKFGLFKCAFDTTQGYTLALDNVPLGSKVLPNNSLATTEGTNVITVTDRDHGFNAGDFVTISGLPAGTLYGGINSNYINGIHRIDSVEWDSYKFSSVLIDGTETVIPTNATSSVIFGTDVISDFSYQYDTLLLNNSEIMLSNTKLSYSFKSLTGRSLDGSETPNVFDPSFTEITNKKDYNTARVKKINSPYNEANLNPSGERSLQVDVLFKTNNENISPAMDATNTNVILVENLINNKYSDETTDAKEGIARYITKDVSLTTQSNGLQVRYAANIQGNANVRVYYKILPLDSTGTLADQPWVEMPADPNGVKANNSTTFNRYTQTLYNLPLFKAFKTKVLMTSPDSTKPPLIREYRAIAFQSIENE